MAAYIVTSLTDSLLEDEILLGRDVLDTQIVDVVGQRLARVTDVVPARTPDGRLNLVGVKGRFWPGCFGGSVCAGRPLA